MSEWVEVCAVEGFPPGDRRVVHVDGVEILVVNVDGHYHAIEDVCSHDGDALGDGPVEGAEVICPRHGARFCLKSGRALTPPAYEPVAIFPTRVVDGRIEVRDDRW
jgi:3-phenylpropionate/trans-cinnamate dioxygenase ferredoxin component